MPLAPEVSEHQAFFRPHFDGVVGRAVNQAHDQVRAARQLGHARRIIEGYFVSAVRLRVNLLEDGHAARPAHQEPEGRRKRTSPVESADVAEVHLSLAAEIGGLAYPPISVA